MSFEMCYCRERLPQGLATVIASNAPTVLASSTHGSDRDVTHSLRRDLTSAERVNKDEVARSVHRSMLSLLPLLLPIRLAGAVQVEALLVTSLSALGHDADRFRLPFDRLLKIFRFGTRGG